MIIVMTGGTSGIGAEALSTIREKKRHQGICWCKKR